MKIFYAESAVDYASYTFPYGVYCVAETEYEYAQIYEQGFLPYTDRVELNKSIFYMARSLRVRLPELSSTSENRRTDRKLDELNIRSEWIDIEDFDRGDSHFRHLCSSYTAERFKEGEMSSERLDYVLAHDLLTHIWMCTLEDVPVGYVLVSQHDNMAHYWYAFISLKYLHDYPLGKWMMWNVLKACRDRGLLYCYLGTVYGTRSLYKVRDHNGIEFYDGRGWNKDKDFLKTLCKNDASRKIKDAFKISDNPRKFIEFN